MNKISVIIPVLNSEDTISRCLSSIENQEGIDLEVIVVDGLSSDNTIDIIKNKYLETVDYLISEADLGQSDAINKGFRHATGNILCWLCADDEFTLHSLEEVAQAFAANPNLQVFSGSCRRVLKSGKAYTRHVSGDSWKRLGYNNEFDQPSMFWSRSVYECIGGVDLNLKVAMDWDYWNKMKTIDVNFLTTPSILSNYYFSETNKTSLDPELHLKETRQIISKYAPNGALVLKLYDHLYTYFDMKGCYDRTAKIPNDLKKTHHQYLKFAQTIFGEDVVNHYNWNWISKMMRDVK